MLGTQLAPRYAEGVKVCFIQIHLPVLWWRFFFLWFLPVICCSRLQKMAVCYHSFILHSLSHLHRQYLWHPNSCQLPWLAHYRPTESLWAKASTDSASGDPQVCMEVSYAPRLFLDWLAGTTCHSLCECVCVHVCVGGDAHVCSCMCRVEANFRYSSREIYPVFWDRGFHWIWNSPNSLVWMEFWEMNPSPHTCKALGWLSHHSSPTFTDLKHFINITLIICNYRFC